MATTSSQISLDYYKFLGLSRSATDDGIKRSYRKMALKFHPEKNSSPDTGEIFAKIAESYDVLSNDRRRAAFDQYGPDGLKFGVPARDGYEGFPGGYQPPSDPYQVFANFFGGSNPFMDFFATETEPKRPLTTSTTKFAEPKFGDYFGGMHGMNRPENQPGIGAGPIKNPPVETTMDFTLEELYNGTVRKVKISRKVLTEDGTTTTAMEKTLTIEIQKGLKDGTRITFQNQGDQGPNSIPADLIFIVRELPHPKFRREGNVLIFVSEINLYKALTGAVIDLITLDGRHLKIPINHIVSPEYIKIVTGEGMPMSKAPATKGDLKIKFRVTYPIYFNEEQKKLLKQAFGDNK